MHESTSNKKFRFSDAFNSEDSFNNEDMKKETYAKDFRTQTRSFEPMARKKDGSRVD